MVPTSAIRETLILIFFGIILVPIAAKRAAYDARGYWQAFPLQDLAASPSPVSSSFESLVVVAAAAVMAEVSTQNETLPAVYATSSAPRAETRPGLTIRFGHATAAGEVLSTAAPSVSQQHQHQHQQQTAAQGVVGEMGEELPTVAKVSDASTGRWTLIWMGSAIATVAVLMSLC